MQINLEDAGQFFENLKNELVATVKENAMPVAANTMLGEYKDRIFSEGKDSTGQQIGTYSRKPQYFTKEQFIRNGSFRGQGRNGDKKKANGAPYKSMYLKEGYYELRQIQGRDNKKKNYNYSSSLLRSIQVVKTETGYAIAITDERESKKFRGNEKRDNKNVGAATDREIEIVAESLVDAVQAKINELLG